MLKVGRKTSQAVEIVHFMLSQRLFTGIKFVAKACVDVMLIFTFSSQLHLYCKCKYCVQLADINLFCRFDRNQYCTGVFLVFILDAFLALGGVLFCQCCVNKNLKSKTNAKAFVIRRLGLNCHVSEKYQPIHFFLSY